MYNIKIITFKNISLHFNVNYYQAINKVHFLTLYNELGIPENSIKSFYPNQIASMLNFRYLL